MLLLLITQFFPRIARRSSLGQSSVENVSDVILPTEELIDEVLNVFFTPGLIPEDSQLMQAILPPRTFPEIEQGYKAFFFVIIKH